METFGCQLNMLLLALPLCALSLLIGWLNFRQQRRKERVRLDVKVNLPELDVYHDIQAWEHSDEWQTIEPLKIQPFKDKYHLTMGLQNLTMSDLVAMDKTYLERVKLRRSIIQDNHSAVIACNTTCQPAVRELHEWLFRTYMPKRFPTMFQRSSDGVVKNLVKNEEISIEEPSELKMLENVGSHIDNDFLILLPSSTSIDGQPIYHLEAFVTCFPSGFKLQEKLGLPLASIHKPVPGYTAKLERSMDRYFAKISTGSIVKRANWTITTTKDLYVQAGTHLYAGMETHGDHAQELARERQSIQLDDCRLRSERQTVHRLPKSGAIVFAFKTYQYKLSDVKTAGDGLALADAIEGLAMGSVPEIHYYKRAVVWADKIIAYLRDEQA